jgi:5'-nucleotidase/UDP-sugar diphosphatase
MKEDIMVIGRKKTGMRVWTALGVSMILALFGLFLMAAPPMAAQSALITLLHVNDTHSHLAAWGPKDGNLDGTLGGLAKAAAIVAAERASDPDALFVHAGDFMEGDFFFNEYLGVPELQLLKSIGLDALVLGNHEFRFGPDFLVSVLQAAWPAGGVPILGTNLDPQGHSLSSWITSTLIKEVQGVKVGFFGLTTPNGALANPAPVVILNDVNPISQSAVDALREAGAQVVVCIEHCGMSAARDLAGNVSGIDVIVNAHDHVALEQPEAIARPGGGTTLIVSAGSHYRWVGRLRLSVAGSQVSLVDYALLSADAGAPSSPAVQATIDALKVGIVARYGDVYHQPLAWAEQDITLDWSPHNAKRDTPLGNLLTDAYRAWTGTDIALEPFAYVGDPLPAGTIVGADVFRSMSYGELALDPVSGKQIVRPWRLFTFRATGEALLHVLDTTLTLGDVYFPQVSGIRFDYDSLGTVPYGDYFHTKHKILRDTVHVNGHKIVTNQLYSVTVTEGLYPGLKGIFGALGLTMQDVQKPPDLEFYAARSFVAQRGELGLATSNRIRDIAAIPRTKDAEGKARQKVITR